MFIFSYLQVAANCENNSNPIESELKCYNSEANEINGSYVGQDSINESEHPFQERIFSNPIKNFINTIPHYILENCKKQYLFTSQNSLCDNKEDKLVNSELGKSANIDCHPRLDTNTSIYQGIPVLYPGTCGRVTTVPFCNIQNNFSSSVGSSSMVASNGICTGNIYKSLSPNSHHNNYSNLINSVNRSNVNTNEHSVRKNYHTHTNSRHKNLGFQGEDAHNKPKADPPPKTEEDSVERPSNRLAYDGSLDPKQVEKKLKEAISENNNSDKW